MKYYMIGLAVSLLFLNTKYIKAQEKDMKYKQLTPEEERVIIHKGTEAPFSGKYYNYKEKGTYICKKCNAPLYRSGDKFDSHCGWPSFDDEIAGAVKHKPDADSVRTEILCNNCGAHLGHVFIGEDFTDKNIRHCVNSISLDFILSGNNIKTQSAYFAGGCFWEMEYFFQKAKGVISTRVGYIGGQKQNPTYNEVCSESTGHAEAVEVIFNPAQISYEELTRLFFEIHDPTQINRQSADIGEQYRSSVFYVNEDQKGIAEKLINILENKGCDIATELNKAGKFWEAEDYHQNYYLKNGQQPYCQAYKKRF
ncbi:MAG: bifunctional methionine sulfoxide reductase B/A protein [Calditrichales bacterium]|nr:bifunctional methionine sulfoxide reductase B/A protein [Calditrichales bacterium]